MRSGPEANLRQGLLLGALLIIIGATSACQWIAGYDQAQPSVDVDTSLDRRRDAGVGVASDGARDAGGDSTVDATRADSCAPACAAAPCGADDGCGGVCTVNCASVSFGWAQRFGGIDSDFGEAVAMDGDEIVICGTFGDNVDFGGVALTSADELDSVVARYTTSGGHLASSRFGGQADDKALAVAVDSQGNVVVVGNFSDNADFGGGLYSSEGLSDIFVASYDASGVHRWFKRFGSSSSDGATGVAIDQSGNVVVVGSFSGLVDFGGDPLNSPNTISGFVASYDADGKYRWARALGGPDDNDFAYDVAADASGNVFVTGEFQSTGEFGGGPLMSAGLQDIFVASYDANGAHRWSSGFGSTSADGGVAVVVDRGGVALTGFFEGAVDFGGGPLTSAGDADIFVASYDAAGKHRWSRALGGTRLDSGVAVATDGSGTLFVSGNFQSSVDFGGGPLISAGFSDVFVASYDAAGAYRWSRRYGGSGSESSRGLVVDRRGNVIVTGSFGAEVNFGGGELISAGSSDIFLLQLVPAP